MSKKASIAVIGLGIFGREVALSLAAQQYPVIAVDRDPATVELLKGQVEQALIFDTTNEQALFDAKINDVGIAVCAIGMQHMQNSIMTTALLHQLGTPRIIARAVDDLHARILRQVGATEVINPEREIGRRIALQITSPSIRELLSLGSGACVAEVALPASFAGKNLLQLQVRQKYGLTVVGIRRIDPDAKPASARRQHSFGTESKFVRDQERKLMLNLEPSELLQAEDVLLVAGEEKDVHRLSGLG